MTAIRFDERSGQMWLTQPAFDRLIAWTRGDATPGNDLDALRKAGIVQSPGTHPALATGLRAVIEPVCELRLGVSAGTGRGREGEGWVRPDVAALLVDHADGERHFVTVHPSLVPAAIAKMMRLGPRPPAGHENLRVTAQQLSSPPWHVWHAAMAWLGADGTPDFRAMHVADRGDAIYLIQAEGEEATLWPTSATTVWKLLIWLIPDSSELGDRAAG